MKREWSRFIYKTDEDVTSDEDDCGTCSGTPLYKRANKRASVRAANASTLSASTPRHRVTFEALKDDGSVARAFNNKYTGHVAAGDPPATAEPILATMTRSCGALHKVASPPRVGCALQNCSLVPSSRCGDYEYKCIARERDSLDLSRYSIIGYEIIWLYDMFVFRYRLMMLEMPEISKRIFGIFSWISRIESMSFYNNILRWL